MNKKTLAIAEDALVDFMKKNVHEYKIYKGRLIKSKNIPKPDQHMVTAALKKVNWYKVELYELEGELDILRDELHKVEDSDNTEDQNG